MSIAVVGTVFVDVKGYPYEGFIPKGRNSGYMLNVHGGVGRNVAEDLGHLGLAPKLVALTDESALAKEVEERLIESGVDTRFIRQTSAGMGTWMAIFDDKGDVAANISIRPDLSPLTEYLDAHHEEIFADADGIILEIDIEPETVDKVFYYAEKYGKKVYALVSVMSIALERRKYFPRTECFICNLQEAGMLFEKDLSALPVTDLENRVAMLAKEAGFSKLIVTLGDKGAVYADCKAGTSLSGRSASDAMIERTDPNGIPLHGYCPAQQVTLVDSTGAGDAFCAGAAAALTAGKSMAEACEAGSRLAASVITSTENVCPPSGIDN